VPINKNFKSIDAARSYIKDSAQIVNPSNIVLKKIAFYIVAGNKNDYDLLKKALIGMKNVKWIGIKLKL